MYVAVLTQVPSGLSYVCMENAVLVLSGQLPGTRVRVGVPS